MLIGGFAEATDVWRKVGPLLGRDHRVYALDLPPFGYSERKGPYDLATWLDEVEGFERALGIARPVLVGHSLGAAVVVGEALRRPRALQGIVLLDGDALGGERRAALARRSRRRPLLHGRVPARHTLRLALPHGAARAYGPAAPPLTAAAIDRWQRPFRVAGTAAAFKQMLPNGIAGWTLADLARVHGVRTVVAWGAHDTVDSVAAGRRSAQTLRAPFVLLPGQGTSRCSSTRGESSPPSAVSPADGPAAV